MSTTHAETSQVGQVLLELLGREDLISAFQTRPGIAGRAIGSAVRATLHGHKATFRTGVLVTESESDLVVWHVSQLLADKKRARSDLQSNFVFSLPASKSAMPLSSDWVKALSLLENLSTRQFQSFEIALDAALDASAASVEAEDASAVLPEALRRFVVVTDPPGEMLGVKEASDRLGIARPTVYEWLRLNKLLGWPRGTTRGHVIPAEQILGKDRVVAGLPDIVAAIGVPSLAWDFLDQHWPFAGGEARPIDKLKTADPQAIQSVIDAAPSYLDSST